MAGFSKLSDKLQKIDLHKQQATISVTYKTAFGGCISILVFCIILGYGVYQVVTQLRKPYEYDFKQFEKPIDSVTAYPFTETDFLAGITIQKKDDPDSLPLDPRNGRFFIKDQTGRAYPTEQCYLSQEDQNADTTLFKTNQIVEKPNEDDKIGRTLNESENKRRRLQDFDLVKGDQVPLITRVLMSGEPQLMSISFELDIQRLNPEPELQAQLLVYDSQTGSQVSEPYAWMCEGNINQSTDEKIIATCSFSDQDDQNSVQQQKVGVSYTLQLIVIYGSTQYFSEEENYQFGIYSPVQDLFYFINRSESPETETIDILFKESKFKSSEVEPTFKIKVQEGWDLGETDISDITECKVDIPFGYCTFKPVELYTKKNLQIFYGDEFYIQIDVQTGSRVSDRNEELPKIRVLWDTNFLLISEISTSSPQDNENANGLELKINLKQSYQQMNKILNWDPEISIRRNSIPKEEINQALNQNDDKELNFHFDISYFARDYQVQGLPNYSDMDECRVKYEKMKSFYQCRGFDDDASYSEYEAQNCLFALGQDGAITKESLPIPGFEGVFDEISSNSEPSIETISQQNWDDYVKSLRDKARSKNYEECQLKKLFDITQMMPLDYDVCISVRDFRGKEYKDCETFAFPLFQLYPTNLPIDSTIWTISKGGENTYSFWLNIHKEIFDPEVSYPSYYLLQDISTEETILLVNDPPTIETYERFDNPVFFIQQEYLKQQFTQISLWQDQSLRLIAVYPSGYSTQISQFQTYSNVTTEVRDFQVSSFYFDDSGEIQDQALTLTWKRPKSIVIDLESSEPVFQPYIESEADRQQLACQQNVLPDQNYYLEYMDVEEFSCRVLKQDLESLNMDLQKAKICVETKQTERFLGSNIIYEQQEQCIKYESTFMPLQQPVIQSYDLIASFDEKTNMFMQYKRFDLPDSIDLTKIEKIVMSDEDQSFTCLNDFKSDKYCTILSMPLNEGITIGNQIFEEQSRDVYKGDVLTFIDTNGHSFDSKPIYIDYLKRQSPSNFKTEFLPYMGDGYLHFSFDLEAGYIRPDFLDVVIVQNPYYNYFDTNNLGLAREKQTFINSQDYYIPFVIKTIQVEQMPQPDDLDYSFYFIKEPQTDNQVGTSEPRMGDYSLKEKSTYHYYIQYAVLRNKENRYKFGELYEDKIFQICATSRSKYDHYRKNSDINGDCVFTTWANNFAPTLQDVEIEFSLNPLTSQTEYLKLNYYRTDVEYESISIKIGERQSQFATKSDDSGAGLDFLQISQPDVNNLLEGSEPGSEIQATLILKAAGMVTTEQQIFFFVNQPKHPQNLDENTAYTSSSNDIVILFNHESGSPLPTDYIIKLKTNTKRRRRLQSTLEYQEIDASCSNPDSTSTLQCKIPAIKVYNEPFNYKQGEEMQVQAIPLITSRDKLTQAWIDRMMFTLAVRLALPTPASPVVKINYEESNESQVVLEWQLKSYEVVQGYQFERKQIKSGQDWKPIGEQGTWINTKTPFEDNGFSYYLESNTYKKTGPNDSFELTIKNENGVKMLKLIIREFKLGFEYMFKVRAQNLVKSADNYNEMLISDWVDAGTYLVIGKPSPPQNIIIHPIDFAQGRLQISWKPPTDLKGNEISRYELYISSDTAENKVNVKCFSRPTENSCILTVESLTSRPINLKDRQTYFVSVVAIGNYKDSVQSDSAESVYLAPPSKPNGLKLVPYYVGNQLIKLTFTSSTEDASIREFRVKVVGNSQSVEVLADKVIGEDGRYEIIIDTEFTQSAVPPGSKIDPSQLYAFQVAIVNDAGFGQYSEQVKFQQYTNQAPIISSVQVKESLDEIKVMWTLPIAYKTLASAPSFKLIISKFTDDSKQAQTEHQCPNSNSQCLVNFFNNGKNCECTISKADAVDIHGLSQGDFIQIRVQTEFQSFENHENSLASQVVDTVWGKKEVVKEEGAKPAVDAAEKLEDNFSLILRNSINDQILFLENKLSDPEYQPSAYQRTQDQNSLEELHTMKTQIKDLVLKRTGGMCPAKELTIKNIREKCVFDYVKYNFQVDEKQDFEKVDECMQVMLNEDLRKQNENSKNFLTQKYDLMIKTDPVFNKKKYIDYAYYPCNQDYENEIESGVVCDEEDKIIKSMKDNNERIGLWWMQNSIVANPEGEDNDAYTAFFYPDKDQFAYKLYPNRIQEQQQIGKVTEKVIVTLKFQKRQLVMIDKNQKETPFYFGTLRFQDREVVERDPKKNEPLVVFRIEFEISEHITIITQNGQDIINLLIAIQALMGGMYTSLSGATLLFVAYVTAPQFTSFLVRNLFLVKKKSDDNQERGEDSDSHSPKEKLQTPFGSYSREQLINENFARNVDSYDKLRNNLEKGELDDQDIENIEKELFDNRYPMREVEKEKDYWYFYLIPCTKLLYKKRTDYKYNSGRVQQAKRKLDKIQDLVRIFQSLHKFDQIAQVILNGPQKLLAKFQRFSLIEDEDVTDSSDQLEDYYDQRDLVKKQLTKFKDMKFKNGQNLISKALLKGVYTNNAIELGRDDILDRNANEKVKQKAQKKKKKKNKVESKIDESEDFEQGEDKLDDQSRDTSKRKLLGGGMQMIGQSIGQPSIGYVAPEMKDFSQQFVQTNEVGLQHESIKIDLKVSPDQVQQPVIQAPIKVPVVKVKQEVSDAPKKVSQEAPIDEPIANVWSAPIDEPKVNKQPTAIEKSLQRNSPEIKDVIKGVPIDEPRANVWSAPISEPNVNQKPTPTSQPYQRNSPEMKNLISAELQTDEVYEDKDRTIKSNDSKGKNRPNTGKKKKPQSPSVKLKKTISKEKPSRNDEFMIQELPIAETLTYDDDQNNNKQKPQKVGKNFDFNPQPALELINQPSSSQAELSSDKKVRTDKKVQLKDQLSTIPHVDKDVITILVEAQARANLTLNEKLSFQEYKK